MVFNWTRFLRAKTGFTLIELLVGLTLWVIAMVGVGRVFHTGLRLWKRIDQQAPLEQEARAILNLWARNYRNAVDVPGVPWSAPDGGISFTYVDGGHIEKVTYRVALNDQGIMVMHQLKQELSGQKIQEVVDTPLTTYATDLTIDYAALSPAGTIVWQPTWRAAADCPWPVGWRARLMLRNGTAAPESFTRAFFLPLHKPLSWAS